MYHYDYPLRKTRLDVYLIEDQNITRYFTDIRDYSMGTKYMIFHRIQGQSLNSPHSCLMVPLKYDILHPRILFDHGRWLGNATTQVKVGNVAIGVQTNQWEVIQPGNEDAKKGEGMADVWHYFASTTKNEPVRLVRIGKNVDVHFIDFETVVDAHAPGMFDHKRVSQVKCTPYRGRHRV